MAGPRPRRYAGDAQAVLVERAGMIGTADEGPHFGDARKVRSVEAADGAAADDADSFHEM